MTFAGNRFTRTEAIFLLAVILLFVSDFQAALWGQDAPGQDIKKARGLEEAIFETEALLVRYPDGDFTPNLMFQLVELYVKRASLKFQREMLLFEAEEEKFEKGLIKQMPVPPKVNFGDALGVATKLLEKYPTVPFRDKVVYRIALCYLEEGNKSRAVEYLQRLGAETNNKQVLEEAYFRLGEYYFEQKDYAKAVENYSRLLESWDSPFFGMALYKLGWSYYNTDNYSQAIGTLVYLIEDVNLLEKVQTDFFGKTKADLRREAIEYVAVCFAEYGGPAKAREFLETRKSEDYTEPILAHMVELYQKRNFYELAIESIQVLVDFYPNSPQTPFYEKRIVENYDLAGEPAKADEARTNFAIKYGPGSPWITKMADPKVKTEVLAIVEEFLYTLGTEAQAKARQTKSDVQYGLAITRYRHYLDKFPRSERSSKVQFYLAECYYEMNKFSEAANAYYDLMMHYPDSEFSEQAAYNRVLAYNNLLQRNAAADSMLFFLFNFLDKSNNKAEIIKVLNPSQAQLLQASNDFLIYRYDSPKYPEVLMKYAEILYELGMFHLAREAYLKLMLHANASGFLPQAYIMVGQCAFKQGNFQEAEDWFLKVAKVYSDSTRYVEKANKMIASSRFKLAESYLHSGDSTRAAAELEIVATVVADTAVAERALFESATIYDSKNDIAKALSLYETFPKRFPQSQLRDKCLFKAGLLSEELEEWERAAGNYLQLCASMPASPLASKSLFFAAKCFENAGEVEHARSYYDEYTKKYKDDPDRYLEAAFKKGEIAFNRQQFETALKDFHFVIAAYEKFVAQNAAVEKYIPANAQFMLGEIMLNSFQNIKLAPPLERNLKRKRTKFEEVIKAYTGAAKYKVADWSTASSYRIGFTFEEFANALLESPRPASLDSRALDDYNQKLWKSVLPFKEKALSAYEANVKQAMENQIDNEWVTKSKKRLESLTLELGVTPLEISGGSGL
jgi:TolA-binding protein